MKLHYYPETDSLHVEFKSTPGAETVEITDGLNIEAVGDIVPGRVADCRGFRSGS